MERLPPLLAQRRLPKQILHIVVLIFLIDLIFNLEIHWYINVSLTVSKQINLHCTSFGVTQSTYQKSCNGSVL